MKWRNVDLVNGLPFVFNGYVLSAGNVDAYLLDVVKVGNSVEIVAVDSVDVNLTMRDLAEYIKNPEIGMAYFRHLYVLTSRGNLYDYGNPSKMFYDNRKVWEVVAGAG